MRGLFQKRRTRETYRLSGLVQDTLLRHPYIETDRVVVGRTPEAMNSADKQVSRSFESRENKRPYEIRFPY